MLFADKLFVLREQNIILQQQLLLGLQVDAGLFCMIERCDCRPKREQMPAIIDALLTMSEELLASLACQQIERSLSGIK